MKTKILVLAALVASLSLAQRQLHIFYKNGTIGSIEESKLDSIVFNKNSAPDSLEGHSIIYHLNIPSDLQGGAVLGTSAGTYLPNTAIIVTAVPAAGYQFGGWRDDAKAAATRTLILKSDTTLTPIFVKTYNLSLSATDGGSVIGAKSGIYAEGTAVTVKAEPAAGYQFVQWSDGVKTAERTIKMEKDTMLSAQFSKICNLKLVAGAGGAISGSQSGAYSAGTLVTLQAVPNSGYSFTSWSDKNTDVYRAFLISSDSTLTASFAPRATSTAKLTISVAKGGTVNAELQDGTSISGVSFTLNGNKFIISAQPAADFQFVKWSDGNTENPRTLNITENTSVSPVFRAGKVIDVKGVLIRMIPVEGGTFLMGAQSENASLPNYNIYARAASTNTNTSYDGPVHQVKLSAYCIAETEVTQALWTAVMGVNPSHHKGNDQYPVDSVSWDDCQNFIKKLNALHLIQGTFSLPTEAQWEYAARGASTTLVEQYAGSDNLDEVGWYKVNSNDSTHAVAQKQPNELGLYDMSGNVSEFCSDWYSYSYSNMSVTDPTGPTSGTVRVLRGGCFSTDNQSSSVFYRKFGKLPYKHIGLRLVCTPF